MCSPHRCLLFACTAAFTGKSPVIMSMLYEPETDESEYSCSLTIKLRLFQLASSVHLGYCYTMQAVPGRSAPPSHRLLAVF